jgi:hypothetical protein
MGRRKIVKEKTSIFNRRPEPVVLGLAPEEMAAREEFMEGSKVKEAQYQEVVAASMEGFIDTASRAGRRLHASLLESFGNESVLGDWSWKPHRDKALGVNFKTFRGVPQGAAEIYGPRICN